MWDRQAGTILADVIRKTSNALAVNPTLRTRLDISLRLQETFRELPAKIKPPHIPPYIPPWC